MNDQDERLAQMTALKGEIEVGNVERRCTGWEEDDSSTDTASMSVPAQVSVRLEELN